MQIKKGKPFGFPFCLLDIIVVDSDCLSLKVDNERKTATLLEFCQLLKSVKSFCCVKLPIRSVCNSKCHNVALLKSACCLFVDTSITSVNTKCNMKIAQNETFLLCNFTI